MAPLTNHGEIMAAEFRVVLLLGETHITDNKVAAQSIEQIMACKPENVTRLEAVKVRDLGPEQVSDGDVCSVLVSMLDNLVDANEHC